MNDSVLLLIKPTFAPYWGGQGPPLAPFFVAPMFLITKNYCEFFDFLKAHNEFGKVKKFKTSKTFLRERWLLMADM